MLENTNCCNVLRMKHYGEHELVQHACERKGHCCRYFFVCVDVPKVLVATLEGSKFVCGSFSSSSKKEVDVDVLLCGDVDGDS